ncbi:unnamed protein product [Acanthoscelides obtectus]|uniref:Lipase domain-containing protein n=1 Tax=Acanthoscelides obtectus TaxID=200917 RepID=A0A9P0L0J4_ACAOB|nr:unnamed protein product [Acanthoscelides obtectus]CAK1624743.1 Pancreatic triacylglycerol lipase [Acanthoscelides obtectus]
MKFECFVIVLSIYLLEKLIDKVKSLNLDLSGDDNSGYFNKCFEELGCVEADSRWFDKKLRPVNMEPADRHVIKTDFLLVKEDKRDHLDEDYEGLLYTSVTADMKSLKSSGFKKSSDLMLLIHDFTSNGYTGWVKENFNYTLDNVHIVGHGVGAHIAGYVGATYNDIRKITGLDPSGPRFDGMPDIVKLSPTNAKYVEVIHTDSYNGRSQGTKELLGHSDFFINNADAQPGCSENNTFGDVILVDRNQLSHGEVLPGCSHKRSFKYFIESLMHGSCSFIGIKCNNYEDFSNGKCTSCEENDSCRTFGAKSYPHSIQKTVFYLDTADDTPFCMFLVKISVSVKTEKERDGYFEFILVDESGDITEAVPSYKKEYKTIKGDSKNTFLYFAHPPQLGRIKEAKVKWNEKKKIYCFLYCDQHINVERVEIEPVQQGKHKGEVSILCPPPEGSKIENGAYKSFSICSSTFGQNLTSTGSHHKNKSVTCAVVKPAKKHNTIHISTTPKPSKP